jgi:large subunit ribosomal protein L13
MTTTTKEKTQHVIDAEGQVLGRLATQIARILQGKHRVSYLPREAGDDVVIVKNAAKIVTTKDKAEKKIYYRHTGYMGHLKEQPFKAIFERDPAEVLRRAVFNMLPKNFIRQKRMNRLKIEK